MGKHRRLKPDCPFVLNPTNSGNVPINNTQPTTSEGITTDLRNEQCRLATFTNWPVRFNMFTFKFFKSLIHRFISF